MGQGQDSLESWAGRETEKSPQAQAAEHANILFVLDLSASMIENGKAKKAIEALESTLDHIPSDVEVGLRILGESEPGMKQCRNTRLVVPLAHNNYKQIYDTLDSVQLNSLLYTGLGNPGPSTFPLGLAAPEHHHRLKPPIYLGPTTPIAEALKEAWQNDFVDKDGNALSGTKNIILLTDGEDNCGNPCKEVRKINKTGINLHIDVFALPGANDSKLNCIVENAAGKLIHKNLSNLQDELELSVERSVQGQFVRTAPSQENDADTESKEKPNCHCH